jgi:hypothetical protein
MGGIWVRQRAYNSKLKYSQNTTILCEIVKKIIRPHV